MLKLEQMTIKFGGLTAVNCVDLQLRQGEIFSLIGPNGAGKTTAFNAITGIYPPSSGRVLFLDKEPKRALSLQVVCNFILIGILAAALLVLGINAEGLWNAAITSNYVYQQPFDWRSAFYGFLNYLRNEEPRYVLYPFLIGWALAILGAYSVWKRSRISPEVVMRSGISRTFQNIRLFKEMSVVENVLLGMDSKLKSRLWDGMFRLPRFTREERSSKEKALAILKFMDLSAFASKEAGNLSYGDQRRLEIARALASEPKLLLLDEPAAGMNPAESMELMGIIRKIRDSGISVMLIEHHMNLVMEVSDRIAVLDYGNKIAEGTPAQIKTDKKVIEAYLGKGE